MADNKVLHRGIRRLASWAIWSFFTEVHVIGGENVPTDGPLIVAATHHNMMLDPAILSVAFPYRRILHYWSKASLFGNPVMKYILESTGNIPVDRKSKDRRKLFKGTFEALSKGYAVALFPEGTSYTEPRIMQVKDGAAWAALEYTKWAAENPGRARHPGKIKVVPTAIVYTDKSKYRSDVILEFGEPITMDAYLEQFMSPKEGDARAAVKRLTASIEQELVECSINAPDWDTLYVARMARDLLWEKNRSIKLDDFIPVSQTLVDLFSTPDAVPNMSTVRRRLLEYYSLLQSTQLSNSVLSSLPLPRDLDPRHPVSLPSRLKTLSVLMKDTLAISLRLPFYLFPLVVHAPIYIMGHLGAKLVQDEEETMAQNKVVFGLLFSFMIYPMMFFTLWAFLWYTPIGAVLAATVVWLLAVYHVQIINGTYQRAKRFVAAWRVLVGVWAPTKWEFSLDALAPYQRPPARKDNPWIDKPSKSRSGTVTPVDPGTATAVSVSSSSSSPSLMPTQNEPPVSVDGKRRRRPSSRRIMRHVLRARVQAAAALAEFFEELERAGAAKRVCASVHMAQAYHGWVEDVLVPPPPPPAIANGGSDEPGVSTKEQRGWRSGTEVIDFLRKRGAKIATLTRDIDGDWAALSSDGEGLTPGTELEEMNWVPSN